MTVKGYVVRGKWGIGRVGAVVRDVYVWWWDLVQDVQWITDRNKVPADGRLLFPTIGDADAALRKSSHLSDVRIFAVAEDGTETPLPSYEEALAKLAAVCAAAEDVCSDYTEEGEAKGPLSLRINRLMAALAARKART